MYTRVLTLRQEQQGLDYVQRASASNIIQQNATSASYVLILLTSVRPFPFISCEVQSKLAELMQTQMSLLLCFLVHQRSRKGRFGRLPSGFQLTWIAMLCSSNVMAVAAGVCWGTRSVRICVPGFRKIYSTEAYTSGGIREAVKTLPFHELVNALLAARPKLRRFRYDDE